MADLKISELPEALSLATNDVLPIVNGGTTKKVTVNSINNALPLTTYVQQASADWNPGSSGFAAFWNANLRNMPTGVLSLVNYNFISVNTDNTCYSLETGTSNVGVDGKIRINKTGIYNVNVLYNSFNISDLPSYSLHLFYNYGDRTQPMQHYSTIMDGNNKAYGADQRVMLTGSGLIHVTQVPMWVGVIFRPTGTYGTGGGPFPSSTTAGGNDGLPLFSQHPKVEIIRVY